MDIVPKFHAHLSPVSAPVLSYHAFSSGSLVVSANSWANTEIMLSTPKLPFTVGDCTQTFPGPQPNGIEILNKNK